MFATPPYLQLLEGLARETSHRLSVLPSLLLQWKDCEFKSTLVHCIIIMGLSITTIRLSAKAAKKASKEAMLRFRDEARALRETNEDTRRKMEERLHILEKMVLGHLDIQQYHIIAGERGDQQIHSGTVVQAFKQVNIVMQDQPSEDIEEAIDEFFKGSFMSGFSKLVAMSVKAVLGNSSMGEYQSSSMLIVWTDNALLRCDTYCYRWNFSSAGVIEQVEGVVGVLMIQRVINLTKTDPQVLSWAITRQARTCPDMMDMFEKAMVVLKKAAKFQREMKAITYETKKHSSRKCSTDDHDKGDNYYLLEK